MSFKLWSKVVTVTLGICVGGPALIYWVSPSEEEIFQKYNPELQKRSLANRRQNQEDFDHFVGKLKEYSKSDRPIWEVAAADEMRARAATRARQQAGQAAPQGQVPVPPRAQAPAMAAAMDAEMVKRQVREEALRSR